MGGVLLGQEDAVRGIQDDGVVDGDVASAGTAGQGLTSYGVGTGSVCKRGSRSGRAEGEPDGGPVGDSSPR